MNRIFRLQNTASLSVRVASTESCSYLYRVMKFIGWIPPKEGGFQRYMYLIWSCFVSGCVLGYLPFGFLLSLVIDAKNLTPAEFLSLFPVTLNSFGATAKGVMAIISLKYLFKTESILDMLDKRVQSDSHRRKIHKAVARCNYIFLVYSRLYAGYILSSFFTGILMGQPPWLIYNPIFNWRQGRAHFWMQSMLELMVLCMMAILELIMDTCPVLFMSIFRAHVDVLKDNIRNLRTDPSMTEADNYNELVACIEDHKLILKCYNLMRPFMSHTIFVQFLLIGIVLGVTMINIMYFSDIFRGISSIVYLIGILGESFPFCYLCDLLVEDCEELSNLLAQSHWIAAQPKYKSTLRIFMHNVQQPINFNAGGIFPISMGTNIKMAKFAFSVMTIVQQMNLADRLK